MAGDRTEGMAVDAEATRALCAGALRIVEEDGFLRADRFTPGQRDHYGGDPVWKRRTDLDAGVGLEFVSDTDAVSFDYRITYRDRDWFHFDLLVDGTLVDSFGEDGIRCDHGRVRFVIGGGRPRRIGILFPHTVALTFAGLRLSPGATLAPCAPKRRRLLCLGDSILQGMDARHPVHAVAHAFARHWDMTLLNQSVGGLVFDARTLDADLGFAPDMILVAYGTNDWDKRADFAEFAANLAAYVDRLVRLFAGIPIRVATPIWRTDQEQTKSTGTLADIRREIARVCARHENMLVLDGERLVPHRPQWFDDRGIHPDDTGQVHYFINALKLMDDADSTSWSDPL